ncbi:hypothetical protein HK098_008187 [Nowakowskiella sp. JEL0407]|nr:hypothetical protein HK098_008187 [Nowakowskiella sp. JEL0407]
MPEIPIQLNIPDEIVHYNTYVPISQGYLSPVYQGTWSGYDVVVKVIRNAIVEDLINRLKHLTNLRHKNIIALLGISSGFQGPLLVLEYFDGESLDLYLRNHPETINGPEIVNEIMQQIAMGMNYLHSQTPPVIHGNLRAENCICSGVDRGISRCVVKLTDFGISRIIGENESGVRHLPWKAPEGNFTEKSDVYAFAMTAYEIISLGKIPFELNGVTGLNIIGAVQRKERPVRPYGTPSIFIEDHWELIQNCWYQYPTDRPSFEKIISTLSFIPAKIGFEKFSKIRNASSSTLSLVQPVPKEPQSNAGFETNNASSSTFSLVRPAPGDTLNTLGLQRNLNIHNASSSTFSLVPSVVRDTESIDSESHSAHTIDSKPDQKREIIELTAIPTVKKKLSFNNIESMKGPENETGFKSDTRSIDSSQHSELILVDPAPKPKPRAIVAVVIWVSVRSNSNSSGSPNPSSTPTPTLTSVIRTLKGHRNKVTSLAVSENPPRLFSGSYDNTILEWDITNGKVVRNYTGHTEDVYAVAVLPGDTPRLFSGSVDEKIREWDTATGETIRIYSGHTDTVTSLAVLPGSPPRLFSGSFDGTVREWDTTTGRNVETFTGHKTWVLSIAVLPGSPARLFSGSGDKTIREWDTATGETIKTFEGHAFDVYALALLPGDPTRLLSASGDDSIREWDTETAGIVQGYYGHKGNVFSLELMTGESTRLFSGSGDSTIKEWNLKTGETIRTFTEFVSTDGGVHAIVSYNSTLFICGIDNAEHKIFQIQV